jgi:class 3 adenylate cyclase
MSETRKLAAILVADVVGYSRLAGADEDRTLALLSIAWVEKYHPIVRESDRAIYIEGLRAAGLR